MAEFGTVFSCSTPAFKPSTKPFRVLLCRFRPQAPDMAFGLERFTLRQAP